VQRNPTSPVVVDEQKDEQDMADYGPAILFGAKASMISEDDSSFTLILPSSKTR
jgi:hypothetical protein